MQNISKDQAMEYEFDHRHPPKLRVAQGESFVVNTSDARYRFKLGDIALGDYDLVVGEGGARIEAAREEPADGVVRCNTADFLLLVTGRLQPGSALGAGRLAAEEGNVLPLVFGDWFKGVWRPKNG